MSEETTNGNEQIQETEAVNQDAAPVSAAKKTSKKVKESEIEMADMPAEAVVEAPAEIQAAAAPRTPVDYSKVVPNADFNWGAHAGTNEMYEENQRQQLETEYIDAISSIEEHQVIDGTVVSFTKKEVIVNIGYKSDGVISFNEFRYNPRLQIGDKVEVYIERTEDKTGQLVLSHKKARTMRAWERVNSALLSQEIVTGLVKCRTKGGLIVDVFGLEAFLPGSQIDVKPIRDYDQYVGKEMDFKVVKINQEFRNVVVSHKALIEAEIEEQKVEIMSKLEKGQVLEGTVKNITTYGVFVDLGGVDGLIHITDLSWGRVNHPEEMLELDQQVQVVILDFDDEKKRIALGMKQLQAHPWDSLSEGIKIGDKVKGKVVVLADYGAFVEIATGVEGLIHVSEMSWSQHLRTANDFFKIGDEVEAIVLTLDRDERKMSLSTRQLTPDPWTGIDTKYPVGSRVKGKVTNLSTFGVFVELEEGVDGLIHISDLSWSKKINHPSEFCKVSEAIEAQVLEIDVENRRLSLGHKQLEENPWEVFETVFTEGSVHAGTLIHLSDKGGVVGLPYGVEGFAPSRHLIKEDGTKARTEEQLDFMVIEFNKDARKIFVSHTRLHEKEKETKKQGEDAAKKVKAASTRKAVQKLNDNQERTTLGDLEALSGLKESMEKKVGK